MDRLLERFFSEVPSLEMPMESKVAVGKPAEEILRLAREEGVDLIVRATDRRTGVRRLLLGSVAEEVTRHAPCPALPSDAKAKPPPDCTVVVCTEG